MWENKIILCATNHRPNKSTPNPNKSDFLGERPPSISSCWQSCKKNRFTTIVYFLTRRVALMPSTPTLKNSKPSTIKSFCPIKAILYIQVVTGGSSPANKHAIRGTRCTLKMTSFQTIDSGSNSTILTGQESMYSNLSGRKWVISKSQKPPRTEKGFSTICSESSLKM